MHQKIKNYLGVTVILGIVLALVAGFWYVESFSKSADFNRTFEVDGSGEVVAVPDVAEITFGVLTEGGTDIATLQEDNSQKVNRIITSMKEHGVADADIQTQSYNISPRRQDYTCPPKPRPLADAAASSDSEAEAETIEADSEVSENAAEPCPPSEIVGYSINQNVSVKIRNIDGAGDIVAAAVENGANNVYGPTFTVDDPTEYQNQARAKAIAEAKKSASATAEAGGFRLGKLISVNSNVSQPPIFFDRAVAQEAAEAGAAPSIEPGSQKIHANVTLRYEIK